MDTAKTGIIFFTRTSNTEARSKKWHPSFSTNLKIANHLIGNTKDILLKTGYDVIVIDETAQRGETFGDKINSAFEDVFLQGYQSLVLLGNDSIGLTNECVTQSIKELSTKPLVFGSTSNDGIYVIGFQKTFFDNNKERISQLPWRATGLVAATSSLSDLSTSSTLPVLSDLNSISDLESILSLTSGSDVFIESLRAIVHGEDPSVIGRSSYQIKTIFHHSNLKKRGPPSYASMR